MENQTDQEEVKNPAGSHNKALFVNTSALFVLQIANYILPFILIPFLTRVLGASVYGVVAFGISMAQIGCIITDYGFNLSATYKIAQYRGDKIYVNQVIGGVMACKLALLLLVVLGIGFYILFQTKYEGHNLFLSLMLLTVLGQTFQPLWFFQGIEEMVYITIYTVASKIIYIILVFLLVHSPSTYYWIAVSNGVANIIAAGVGLTVMYRKGYKPTWPGRAFTKKLFTDSSEFFLSRAAFATYSVGGAFFLGLFSTPLQVAYYAAAEQLYKGARSLFDPLNQALYPHMAKHRNFKLFFKVLAAVVLGSVIIVTVGIFTGNFFINLFFGPEFTACYPILVVFLMTFLVSAPSVLLGYPFLGAIGYISLANKSVIYAGIVQISLLALCYFLKLELALHVAFTVFAVECVVLCLRTFWARSHYRQLKSNN